MDAFVEKKKYTYNVRDVQRQVVDACHNVLA